MVFDVVLAKIVVFTHRCILQVQPMVLVFAGDRPEREIDRPERGIDEPERGIDQEEKIDAKSETCVMIG